MQDYLKHADQIEFRCECGAMVSQGKREQHFQVCDRADFGAAPHHDDADDDDERDDDVDDDDDDNDDNDDNDDDDDDASVDMDQLNDGVNHRRTVVLFFNFNF